MSSFNNTAFKLFGRYSEQMSLFFPDLKADLKKARMRTSAQEYVSMSMMVTFVCFLIEIPLLSFIFAVAFKSFFFGFITSFTASAMFSVVIFVLFTKYPKTIVSERAKKIDAYLPFASIHLSTISSTKLPLDKVFKIFTKFSRCDEITNEIQTVSNDIETFGLDINTALERAAERSPSKNFKELMWGILSIQTSGGDISTYLREKSKGLMQDYRRQLEEFSKKIMLFTEIYMTAIILGAIFFVILFSIFSGISGGTGGGGSPIVLQALLIFVLIPLVSMFFLLLIKASTPGGE